jgi:hypothetical protein
MAMPQPVGPISVPEYLAAKAFLRSAEFRTFIGAGSSPIPAPENVEGIKFEIIERPNPELDYFEIANMRESRPFLCIWPFGLQSNRIASQSVLYRGNIQLLFEQNYDQALLTAENLESESEVIRWWKNRVGKIISEAFSSSHDTIFNIQQITEMNWWTRSPIEPEDQHLGFTASIGWGPNE